MGTSLSVISQSVSFSPKLRRAINDVLGGSAASVLTVTFGLSYSLLIFGGPLAPYLSYGVAATFISSAILAAVIALGSSLPFAIGGPESSTAAMTGILASSMVERMTLADTSAPLLAPVIITLALASIATGLVLCGFGLTRMGRAIRYVPYPVVGGFLGAMLAIPLTAALRTLMFRYVWTREPYGRPEPEEVVEGKGAFLVAYAGGKPIGCGAIRRLDPETGEIIDGAEQSGEVDATNPQ